MSKSYNILSLSLIGPLLHWSMLVTLPLVTTLYFVFMFIVSQLDFRVRRMDGEVDATCFYHNIGKETSVRVDIIVLYPNASDCYKTLVCICCLFFHDGSACFKIDFNTRSIFTAT